ncbi:MAG: cupin domain-containing protein [Gammaproteobacteria bacterium]|nr:cupin domain-containing protein [Gammaproteobacteria bacterium]
MNIKNIPDELDEHPEGTFLNLIKFNGNSVGAGNISGESPVWEMHPDTDELFYIIEGEVEFTLLEETGAKKYKTGAGAVFAVPKGIWHKGSSPSGVKFVYLTPGETLHSEAKDPRKQQVFL